MVRRRRFGVLLALAMTIAGPGLQAQPSATSSFIPGLEDVPLMAGLALDETRGFVFDKPDGRLVEAVATGRIPAAEIARFYADVLSQLGWRRRAGAPDAAEQVFRRNDEVLTITTRATRQGLVVRFSLAPRAGH